MNARHQPLEGGERTVQRGKEIHVTPTDLGRAQTPFFKPGIHPRESIVWNKENITHNSAKAIERAQ